MTLPYVCRWNRQGRKGEPCDVLIRTKAMNSCLVRFVDGYTMVTSRNAIAKNHPTSSDLFMSDGRKQVGKMSDIWPKPLKNGG